MKNQMPKTKLRRTVAAGLALVALLFGALGGWAATTSISGAIIAPGQITVRGKPQEVQHLDGGLIDEILVAEGDRVKKGEILLRLDPTSLEMRRDIARAKLATSLAEAARLRSEKSGAEEVSFDYPDLPLELPDMSAAEAEQQHIFESRQESRRGRQQQLAEALADYDDRIAGTKRQLESLNDSLELVDADLERIGELAERQLVRQNDVSSLRRNRVQIVGQREALRTELTMLVHERSRARTDAAQTEQQLAEQIVSEHAGASAKAEELAYEIVDIEAKLDRVEIRAPADGIVHEMQVATTGGVIPPGETILKIVPQDRGLVFETRIDPRQIDQVHRDQAAEIMVAAFDPRSTPRLEGRVTLVSPDTILDPRTGREHFNATVSIPPEELERLGEVDLVPGMPVEAYLKTSDRTVMAYLLEPLSKTVRHAMRQ